MPADLPRGRATVLRALWGQPDPVRIEALALAVGRHTNTVREEVTWLVRNGLVERVRESPVGRGRPAWLYRAWVRGPSDDDFVEFAAALAWRLQDSSAAARAEALDAGRQRGHELAATRQLPRDPGPTAGRRWTVDLLDDLGYEPEPDADLDQVNLHRCPLLQAAHQFRGVVCAAHLGLLQASLENSGADPERAHVEPFAAPGLCTVRLDASIGSR